MKWMPIGEYPKEAGFYFHRKAPDKRPWIHGVRLSATGALKEENSGKTVEELGGQWAGPIPFPGELSDG